MNNEKFYGYVTLRNGMHEAPVELDSTDIEGIAHFICDDFIHDKIITDGLDLPVVTTFGNFLNYVDQSKIDFPALQKACIKLQDFFD